MEDKDKLEIIHKIECGFVDEWQIRSSVDVHPSHRTKVFTMIDLDKALDLAFSMGIDFAKNKEAQKRKKNA